MLGDEAKRILAFASLAALALGILWSLEAATHVERTEQVRTLDAWSEQGKLTYEPLRADNSTLPMGEPGYFTTEAPRVRLLFAWTMLDEEAERVTALGDLKLIVQRDATAGRAAWTHTENVASATLAGPPAEPLAMSGEIDLPGTEARIRETPGRDPAGAKWSLVATVRFASAPEEAHAADASEFSFPISYTPPLYVLPDEAHAAMSKDHTQRETTTTETEGGLRALVERPVGVGLLLAGLAGLAATVPTLSRDEEAPE